MTTGKPLRAWTICVTAGTRFNRPKRCESVRSACFVFTNFARPMCSSLLLLWCGARTARGVERCSVTTVISARRPVLKGSPLLGCRSLQTFYPLIPQLKIIGNHELLASTLTNSVELYSSVCLQSMHVSRIRHCPGQRLCVIARAYRNVDRSIPRRGRCAY